MGKGLAFMIGGPAKSKADATAEDDEEKTPEPDMATMTATRAAKDAIRAVEDKDPKALDKALRAHYAACKGTEEEESE